MASSLNNNPGNLIKKMVEDEFNKTKNYYSCIGSDLAGIVMSKGPDFESAEVIAVSSGSHCIAGNHMTYRGNPIKIGHAVVSVRNQFKDFLRKESKLLHNTQDDKNSIFIKTNSFGLWKDLKDGIKFHLYISTAPCGDASVFNRKGRPQNLVDPSEEGQLRPFIKEGENSFRTMSCSDKIAKWNVVGLQGSFLSYACKPVYLSSITVGDDSDKAHLYRALFGRIQGISNLSSPYRVNEPQFFFCSDNTSQKEVKKCTINCLNGENALKIKRRVKSKTSRDGIVKPHSSNYGEARDMLKGHFISKSLGDWNTITYNNNHY